MSDGEFKDRGPFPAQRRELEGQIARQKRVDVEGEISEMKSDDDVSSFTNFVRGQGVTADDLTHDDLSFFIRYGDLTGLGMGSEVSDPKEARLRVFREAWEKRREERRIAGKKDSTPEV